MAHLWIMLAECRCTFNCICSGKDNIFSTNEQKIRRVDIQFLWCIVHNKFHPNVFVHHHGRVRYRVSFWSLCFCLCFEFSFIFCKFQFILPFSLFSFTTPILSLKQNVCYRKSMRKVCCTNNFYLGYKSVKVVQVLLSIQSAPCFIGQCCSE